MFTRARTRAGIRTPWVTPHACRHTHATAMWEGGMRELSLQKRLAHASPESVKVYTRVSDEAGPTQQNPALATNQWNKQLATTHCPQARRPSTRSRIGRSSSAISTTP